MKIIGKTASGLLVDATEDEMCRLTGYQNNWYRKHDGKPEIGVGSVIDIDATYKHIAKVNGLKDEFERARAALDYLTSGLVLTRDSLHTALTPPETKKEVQP